MYTHSHTHTQHYVTHSVVFQKQMLFPIWLGLDRMDNGYYLLQTLLLWSE